MELSGGSVAVKSHHEQLMAYISLIGIGHINITKVSLQQDTS
jgi:hypothetical protein